MDFNRFPFVHKSRVFPLPRKVLLLGFPNVGKSLLFHRLTGTYVIVSNYPGTTVEVVRGKAKINGRDVEIIDTPGIYSLKGQSQEEKVTLKFLEEEKPHLILFIAESAALPRMLQMLLEVKDFCIPMVLVLNMIEEARKKGIYINVADLEKELQLPVVAVECTKKLGIDHLKNVIKNILFPSFTRQAWQLKQKKGACPGVAADCALREQTASRKQLTNKRSYIGAPFNVPGSFFKSNRGQNIFLSDLSLENRLHLLLINPWFGYPIAFLLLFFGFYLFLGVFGAGKIVRLLEEKIFVEIVIPYFRFWAEKYIGFFYLRELICGEYGLVAVGLRYSLAIVLPIVTIFFLFFGLLEDCGYLPRLSYLLHRPLRYLGLDGRGAIPLVMGFGCGTMAVLVTRLLETPRERFLATFLLSLGIPCSAQLGLLIAILSPYPLLLLLWGLSCGVLFAVAGALLNRFYPGEKSYLCYEFPPLRLPQISAIFRKTSIRIIWYLREILPFFLLISLLFQFMIMEDFIAPLEGLLLPFFQNLGLPREAIRVFIFGFLRRDYAAAGFYDLMYQGVLTPASALVGSTVLTLFFPCIAQFTLILKERGLKETLLILLLIALASYSVGFILHTILSFSAAGLLF